MKRSMSDRRPRGLSLVESLTTLTLVAVVLGSGLPSLQTLQQRRELEGSAAQLETDLQLARASAVAHAEVLRMDFLNGAGGSCYVLHDGAAGDCACGADGLPVCSGGVTVLRGVHFGPAQPVALSANVASIAFDPVKGTVTPTATIRLTTPAGQLRTIINLMGRVRSCTPDASIAGHRRC
jgi:type IV fimbrial biogenesis protein FimT